MKKLRIPQKNTKTQVEKAVGSTKTQQGGEEMRLIDADKLTHDLTDWQMELYSDIGHEKEFDILDKVINGISIMPTEVTVVRCKDCEHSYEDLHGRVCAYGRCLNCDVDDDWFCADGERRSE